MGREYPERGLRSHPDVGVPGPQPRSGPRNEEESRPGAIGTRTRLEKTATLTFPVLDAAPNRLVGHVRLKNRDGGQVGTGQRGEISCWTAAGARRRGIAPAAVGAVTDWAFSSVGTQRPPCIMLAHDVDDLIRAASPVRQNR